MRLHAVRLRAGQDLRRGIVDFARQRALSAAAVVCAVGSLSAVRLRMAGAQPDAQDIRDYEGSFEIVSLVGTISADCQVHLHLAISDASGQVIGGHLKDGCIVHTTVELVLADEPLLRFSRALDAETGFDELRVESALEG